MPVANKKLSVVVIDPATKGYYETDVNTYKLQLKTFFPDKTDDELNQMVKDASGPAYKDKLEELGFSAEDAETMFESVFAVEITG